MKYVSRLIVTFVCLSAQIAFKYRPNIIPVSAKGIVSIGQFGVGIINISQFGLCIISISQFTIAVYTLAQFATAYSLISQIGLYVKTEYGQFVWNIFELTIHF